MRAVSPVPGVQSVVKVQTQLTSVSPLNSQGFRSSPSLRSLSESPQDVQLVLAIWIKIKGLWWQDVNSEGLPGGGNYAQSVLFKEQSYDGLGVFEEVYLTPLEGSVPYCSSTPNLSGLPASVGMG